MYNRYIPRSKGGSGQTPQVQPNPSPPPEPQPISQSAITASPDLFTPSFSYARYIPQSKPKPPNTLAKSKDLDDKVSQENKKRKHESTNTDPEEVPKKSKRSEDSKGTKPPEDGQPKAQKKLKGKRMKEKGTSSTDRPIVSEPRASEKESSHASQLESQATLTQGTLVEIDSKSQSPEIESRRKTPKASKIESSLLGGAEIDFGALATDHARVPVPTEDDGGDGSTNNTEQRKKKKKAKKTSNDTEVTQEEEDEGSQRHKAVLAKKAKSLTHSAEELIAKEGPSSVEDQDFIMQDVGEMHGLEPLPQPIPLASDTSKPSYETLPPWLASPIRVAPSSQASFSDLGIPSKSSRILESRGFKNAFAVQTAAIPLLMPTCKQRQGDVLIAAATGSGKTLAYALPIAQDISQGIVTRLRALIVLPTRELVKQAQEVFELCANACESKDGKRLKVGIAIGSQPLKYEQNQLVDKRDTYNPHEHEKMTALKARRRSRRTASDDSEAESSDDYGLGSRSGFVVEYGSKVDVLICTPGRLVEHVNQTQGFSLDFVRWLVVDEADKLLAQSFQGWLEVIMPHLTESRFGSRDFNGSNLSGVRKVILSATLTRDLGLLQGLQLRRPQLIVLEGRVAMDDTSQTAEHSLPALLKESAIRIRDANLKPLYLQHLLLSDHMVATPAAGATDDLPATTALFQTLNTKAAITVENDSDTSSSGSESDSNSDSGSDSSLEEEATSESSSDSDSSSDSSDSAVSTSGIERKAPDASDFPTTVLIFTKSNESALRLSRLLSLLSPPLESIIGTLTSATPTAQRRRTLRAFESRRIRILVASDLVARGIDLPRLDHVINYDLPPSVAAYVHRVGRTARAGRAGCAWTLLPDSESGWFWGKIAKGSGLSRHSKVDRVRIGDEDGEFGELAVKEYEEALERLGQEAKEMRVRN
jgi:ATP-dependent RNA helicase DDX51/DBP6